MTRLPLTLTSADLSIAELCALRLDGELFAIDDAFSPVDAVDSASLRSSSIAYLCQQRLIAEQRSAAWIWGASDTPPARHELCASLGARSRPVSPKRSIVREVVIDDADVIDLGGVRVTNPMRTILDLARFSDDFDASVESLVSRLLALYRISVEQCLIELDGRRNLPNKRRAKERLSRCQPA
jgi:Fe-S-cluster formation regulator IscX/YfhJ